MNAHGANEQNAQQAALEQSGAVLRPIASVYIRFGDTAGKRAVYLA